MYFNTIEYFLYLKTGILKYKTQFTIIYACLNNKPVLCGNCTFEQYKHFAFYLCTDLYFFLTVAIILILGRH